MTEIIDRFLQADIRERLLKGPEHVRPRGQVAPPGGEFRPEEVTHRRDARRHGCQRRRPARFHDFAQIPPCHGQPL